MSEDCFYTGAVMHRRYGDVRHRLRYPTAYVCIDVDELDRGASPNRLFRFNRSGVLCVRAHDYGAGGGNSLGRFVRERLREAGVTSKASRIRLLTLPRMLGFVFNPVSFYFIHDEDDRLHHILCEVNNTFGGRSHYLLPIESEERSVISSCQKTFYVSPFFEVAGAYRFRIRPPKEKVSVVIEYFDVKGERAMTACLSGSRKPFTSAHCLRVLLSYPFMTLGVVVAIHWEAVKLWLKGARLRPDPTKAAARINAARRQSAPDLVQKAKCR